MDWRVSKLQIPILSSGDPQWAEFLRSSLKLMHLTLPCPEHTTLSRRHATVTIRRKIDRAPHGPGCVMVDSTGLKVCGQGEWHRQKHGEKKVKRWKRLHVGIDDQGAMVASTGGDNDKRGMAHVVPDEVFSNHRGRRGVGGGGHFDH